MEAQFYQVEIAKINLEIAKLATQLALANNNKDYGQWYDEISASVFGGRKSDAISLNLDIDGSKFVDSLNN